MPQPRRRTVLLILILGAILLTGRSTEAAPVTLNLHMRLTEVCDFNGVIVLSCTPGSNAILPWSVTYDDTADFLLFVPGFLWQMINPAYAFVVPFAALEDPFGSPPAPEGTIFTEFGDAGPGLTSDRSLDLSVGAGEEGELCFPAGICGPGFWGSGLDVRIESLTATLHPAPPGAADVERFFRMGHGDIEFRTFGYFIDPEGQRVSLPGSRYYRARIPEASTISMLAIGLSCVGLRWRRLSRLAKDGKD
jgi:hypothetical protein